MSTARPGRDRCPLPAAMATGLCEHRGSMHDHRSGGATVIVSRNHVGDHLPRARFIRTAMEQSASLSCLLGRQRKCSVLAQAPPVFNVFLAILARAKGAPFSPHGVGVTHALTASSSGQGFPGTGSLPGPEGLSSFAFCATRQPGIALLSACGGGSAELGLGTLFVSERERPNYSWGDKRSGWCLINIPQPRQP